MFRNIITKIKEVLYKMGLISGIKQVTQHKDVAADEEFYQKIDVWNALYKGYYEDFHKVFYHTINGERTRRMQTLNMPKVIADELAKLVFNEKCKINISNETFSDNVYEVLKSNQFYGQFQRYLEYCFALGGMVLKVYADQAGIRISYVTADCFIPVSHSSQGIDEGLFVNQTRKGDKYYTLLEWHTWEREEYVILNELYRSDNRTEMGVKVNLGELYPNLQPETRINNLSRPLFVYVKPNIANNFDTQSPLGISVYANALDTLQALDVAFDSFMREFRLGKKRILVPHTAVKTVVDSQTGKMHRYFDANDEVYQAFNFDQDSNEVKDISVEIRVEEHIAAIQALLDLLSMQTGFSAGTFTFDGQGVKTATEVVSENSKTFRTKNSHETVIEEGVKQLITTIADVAGLYSLFPVPVDFEVSVDFDDSIAEDRNSNADYYLKLKNGGLMSAKQAMMRVLKITEEEAEQMLQEIREEQRTRTPDIDEMFGGNAG
ncbi:phage portal protein [Alteribacillus sp. JSM 102045]|uniref:phage portal protein n=1 Tax=Alteribacillus sp. JSM 102045 TaxID=1562101 RepID=UPI0035C15B28